MLELPPQRVPQRDGLLLPLQLHLYPRICERVGRQRRTPDLFVIVRQSLLSPRRRPAYVLCPVGGHQDERK